METMLKREEVATTSQLVGLLDGDPPRINLVDYATGRNGIKRHFTQQVSVLDENLFARLQREVKAGEHIRVTIVNEYYKTKIVTYVADFQKTINTSPNETSGTETMLRDMSQLPLTTSKIEPILPNRTQVRK